MKAPKRISDPWVVENLSRSSSPITLLAGAWTSKALGKGGSCSVAQHRVEHEAVDSVTRTESCNQVSGAQGSVGSTHGAGTGSTLVQVKQASILSQKPLKQAPVSRSG